MSGTKQRKYIAIIVMVVLIGICAGLVSRSGTTKTFLSFAVEETKEKAAKTSEIKSPSCYLDVNKFNSIAVRQALLKDAIDLIPLAGTFGFGLDSFVGLSCMSMQVHNSALQAFVELGWIGGAILIALVIISFVRLLPTRHSNEVRFVLCGLAYIIAISLAHGRTSRDILLFALLGLSSSIFETYRGSLAKNERGDRGCRCQESRSGLVGPTA